jgi:hypothetical protein
VQWGELFSKAWSQTSPSARATARDLLGSGLTLPEHGNDAEADRSSLNAPLTETIAALFDAISSEFPRLRTDFRVARVDRSMALEDFFYRELCGHTPPFDGWLNSLLGSEAIDVNFSEEAFYRWTGGLTVEQSLTLYQHETGQSLSRDLVKILFTQPAEARAILTKDQDIHLHYRTILNANVPPNIAAARQSNAWVEMAPEMPFRHTSLPAEPRKFVAEDGHREVLFRADGSLDTKSAIHGTFNFFSPHEFPLTHIAVDVGPYFTHL